MSGPDFSGWTTEKLVETYWSMPMITADDDAFIDAVCDELVRRQISLVKTLGLPE